MTAGSPRNPVSTADDGSAPPCSTTTGRLGSWRTAGVGIASLGTPASIGMLQPMAGEVIAFIEVAVMLTIIGTALFGSSALSERAFRLLRWIANRPEPPTQERA